MTLGFRLTQLLSTWQLVGRRILAHWRLLSPVVVGVLLASAMMAGTVLYFDSLRDLALQFTLDKLPEADVNVILVTEKGPTNADEYEAVSSILVERMDPLVGWTARRVGRTGKSAVFAVAPPDQADDPSVWDGDGRANFIFVTGLGGDAAILPGGRMPGAGAARGPGEPLMLEAMAPADQAEAFGLAVGDRIAAIPATTGPTPHVLVTITGLFEAPEDATTLRDLDERVLRRGTQVNFRQLQLYISEETYLETLGPSFPRLDSIYAWHLDVDRGRLNSRNSRDTLVGLIFLSDRLGSSLYGYEQITGLDDALREFERRHFFTKLPMLVAMILIVIVILYYIVMIASMVVARQRGEIVLMRSRGATSAQIFMVFLIEAGTLSLAAAVVGPLIAGLAIGSLGYTPAFSGLTGGDALPVDISGASYGLSAVGALLAFAALLAPALQASRVGVARYRQESARPARQPWFQKYYVDVVVLLAALLMFRQLSEQGSVVATSVFGDTVVDQVLLAMPALMLAAWAMVLLRLLPLGLALGSRLMSNRLSVGLALGLWQMARNPTHYARLSMLLILMAGLGVFVASVGGTLQLNYEERVLYSTGSDMRAEGIFLEPRGLTLPFSNKYEEIEGVARVMPAYRGGGFDLSKTPGKRVGILAVDSASFGDVAWRRPDFAEEPLDEMLESLVYPAPPEGIAVPLDAGYVQARVRADRPHDSVEMVLRVRDANDRHFSFSFGALTHTEWTDVSANVRGRRFSSSNRWVIPVPPLRLLSVVVSERNDRRQLEPGWVLIDELRAVSENGRSAVLEDFSETDGWSALRTTTESVSDSLRGSANVGGGGSALFSWAGGTNRTSRGIHIGEAVSPVAVLASERFLKESGHIVGDQFDVTVGGGRMPVRIAGKVDYFPTLDTVGEPWIVADLESMALISNIEATYGEIVVPNEAWLVTEEALADREALGERLRIEPFASTTVYDRSDLLSTTQVDPLLDAGWRALLNVAFVTVLILSCIGFLVHTYVSFREREGQFALLRAVGLSMNQLTLLIWIEQALVVAAGLALGTWMGGQVGATIMTFLGHDDTGGRVLPPYTLDVDWVTLISTYTAIIAVFTVIIAVVVVVVRRLSLQQVLRFGEG